MLQVLQAAGMQAVQVSPAADMQAGRTVSAGQMSEVLSVQVDRTASAVPAAGTSAELRAA